ncbi:MAG: WD40/YVTN/BNR-like repeat-containing protein [Solirubrobacterales bacterium]|jgi:photosystem II stability/assembly factor-like uncharacterized protein
MPALRSLSVKNGDVLLLVGTMKGAFLLRSRSRSSSWEMGGPYFPGAAVYAMAYDDRGRRPRLWAAAESMHWGSVLHSSDNFGKTWTNPEEANVRYPEDTGLALSQIWQICPGRADEPKVLYCGVAPAGLFETRDGGRTWSLVRGLFDHPHRPKWEPGGGGLTLHTIVPHPTDRKRLLVAISTGGVYRTEDGGRSFQASNRGIGSAGLPDKHPEFGQCVHKVVRNASRPERFFLQNHGGLYRSDDGGQSWQDMANGVPSDFGFAMAAHPHDPDTVYIIPLESDRFRCVPEGKLRVYRTRDAGKSWRPLAKGLPQRQAYETVLRDGLATDTKDPAGVYFGTRSGNVFASRDEGASWKRIVEGLPPVVCVKAAVVGSTVKARRGRQVRLGRAARRS